MHPPSRKWRDVSGSSHSHDEFADSLRLSAHFVHSTDENCGTPQALCASLMKSYDRLRLCALFARAADYWVVQQAAVGGLLHDSERAHKMHTQLFLTFIKSFCKC